MEIYLAAILSFYLKPRQRLWDPDGIETLVQIAAPRTPEVQRTKNVSVSEAEQRLRYLANLSDSRGWSVRGVSGPDNSSLNADVLNEAEQTQDILDGNNTISQNLGYMISQSDQRRHQEMLSRFQSAAATPPMPTQQPSAPPTVTAPPVVPVDDTVVPQFNPYPTAINQTVIQPLSAQPVAAPAEPTEPPISTSANPVSPDIMKLASNADLSIETIAREAHRITEKEAELNDEEVIISLR